MEIEIVEQVFVALGLVVLGSESLNSSDVAKALLAQLRHFRRCIRNIFHYGSDILTGTLCVKEQWKHDSEHEQSHSPADHENDYDDSQAEQGALQDQRDLCRECLLDFLAVVLDPGHELASLVLVEELNVFHHDLGEHVLPQLVAYFLSQVIQ